MKLTISFFLALLVPTSFAADISFSFERLSDLIFGPRAMNDNGWIVGSGYRGGIEYPYRSRPGVGSEQLSRDPGSATDINDAGTITGHLSRNGQQKVFVQRLGQAPTMIGRPEDSVSYASSINNAGQVAGYSRTTATSPPILFLYTPSSGMVNLGSTISQTIILNSEGQILIGEGYTILYDPQAGFTNLRALTGQQLEGSSFSDSGIVAGRSVYYSPATGLRDIGSLGRQTEIRDVNNRGWIVGSSYLADLTAGTRAFLYVEGQGMKNLNDLVPGLDATLSVASIINDRNQILAYSDKGYYLLTPR